MIAASLLAISAWLINTALADCGDLPGCDSLRPLYDYSGDAHCVVDPNDQSYLELAFQACPCNSNEAQLATIQYTDINGAVNVATAAPIIVAPNQEATLSAQFNVPYASISPGSYITVTHAIENPGNGPEDYPVISFVFSTQVTQVYTEATSTLTITETDEITETATVTSTETVSVPQSTGSTPCLQGTVTNFDTESVSTTVTSTPDVVFATATLTTTITDTASTASTSIINQETSTSPCTTGTLTSTVRAVTRLSTTTLTPRASTKTKTVETCITKTKYIVQTRRETPKTVVVSTNPTKTGRAKTVTKSHVITAPHKTVTKTAVTTSVITTSCVQKPRKRDAILFKKRSGSSQYELPNCDAVSMTTYTTGTSVTTTSSTTTATDSVTERDTVTTSLFSDPATTYTCSDYWDTTVQTTTTTSTIVDQAATPTSTITQSSSIYETVTNTVISTVTPNPATTTVCSNVQATRTVTPTCTKTITAHAQRPTVIKTLARAWTHTVISHSVTTVPAHPATITVHHYGPITTVYPTKTINVTKTLSGGTSTVTTKIVCKETKYPSKYPPVCGGRPQSPNPNSGKVLTPNKHH